MSKLALTPIAGIIKRRLLVNFRADPDIVARVLPAGFRPKLHDGHAIAGICLIRLESARLSGLPRALGLSSENAAHRIAVEWQAPDGSWSEGVFIPRRDTDSPVNSLAARHLAGGVQHRSRFAVQERDDALEIDIRSRDQEAHIHVWGRHAGSLPRGSVFRSLAEASAFFQTGSVGFSVTPLPDRLDGIELRVERWETAPFEITSVRSSYFDNTERFPPGSIAFDHCLIMRDIPHTWHPLGNLAITPAATAA